MPACRSNFLCLEEAERPQWPRVYSLGSPRSHSHMPNLVGDSDQVHGVLGRALTRIHNLLLVLQCCRQDISTVLCVEQSSELLTDIRGEVGLAMYASTCE